MSQSTTANHLKNFSNTSILQTRGRKEASSLKLGQGQKVNTMTVPGQRNKHARCEHYTLYVYSKLQGSFNFVDTSGGAKSVRGLTQYVLLRNK